MANTSHKTLARALPIVARALGEKYDLEVRIDGNEASTNGRVINIPKLDPDSERAAVLAYGYLDHEAAHVRFTDFQIPAESEIQGHLRNVLEDVRIEREMPMLYPGTRRNLRRLEELMIEDGLRRAAAPGDHPAGVVGNFVSFRLGADILKYQALEPLASESEQVLRDTLPAGAVTRLMALMTEAGAMQSTQDAHDLASSIIRMLQEEEKKEREKEQRQNQNDSSNSVDKGNDEGGPDDPEHAQDEGESPDGDSTDQDNAGADNDSGVTPTSGSATDEQPGQSDPEGDEAGKGGAEALRQILGAGNGDVEPDKGQLAAQLLESEPESDSFFSGMAEGEEVCLPMAPHDALLNEARRGSTALRTRLAGLLQASQLDHSWPASSGRLNRSQLSRLTTGNPRVFLQEEEHSAVNTAVYILLDRSGSMSRNVDLASMATLATALALESIQDVQVATGAFPGTTESRVFQLTRFGERVATTTSRYGIDVSGGTPMAEAMWFGASELLKQQDCTRKIMMVVTDGMPNNRPAAEEIIDRMAGSGIELFGIGINQDVSSVFSHHMMVSNIQELAPAMFAVLQQSLMAHAA